MRSACARIRMSSACTLIFELCATIEQMSDVIELHSRVRPDGSLDIHVPPHEMEAGTDVVVTIRRVPGPINREEWHRFVDETYGSCAGLGLERQPQGEFEQRENLE